MKKLFLALALAMGISLGAGTAAAAEAPAQPLVQAPTSCYSGGEYSTHPDYGWAFCRSFCIYGGNCGDKVRVVVRCHNARGGYTGDLYGNYAYNKSTNSIRYCPSSHPYIYSVRRIYY